MLRSIPEEVRMSRRVVHLVCNAHLDPVWLWHWEDGLAEALATFRVAADFCEQESGFVFNHNEALLYHWVERFEPGLFARIQRLVAAGSWHIAGGAWLQPDVNGPSAESHIRQFLVGLQFFTSRFGQRPTTAYNFDPFGHPEGFAGLLAGCGMRHYVFCRPDHGTWDLPVGAFRWRDRSGREVIARRSDDHYHTNGKVAEDLDRWLPHYADEGETMILWGIGNHGGGPSRAEWQRLQDYIAAHPDYDFRHSTPDAFFATVQADALPVVDREIQNSFPGCYTSMARVKRAHRRCEGLVRGVEALAALAWWLGRQDYPGESLTACWRDILFAEFHDILPGTCIPTAERDTLDMLGGCADRLRRLRLQTIWSLLAGEPDAEPGSVPVFVVNQQAARFRGTVAIECNLAQIPAKADTARITVHDGGRELPVQRVRAEHNVRGDWRVRLLVPVDLAPFAASRLTVRHEIGRPRRPRVPAVSARNLRFRSAAGSIVIDPRTGLVDRLVPTGSRRSLVGPGAFRPVIFADTDHSWTSGDPRQEGRIWSTCRPFQRPRERFRLASAAEAAALSPLPQDRGAARPSLGPIRIIDHGPLRTVVEVHFVAGPSAILRRYEIDADGGFAIHDRLFVNHRNAMFKLSVPLPAAPEAVYSEAVASVAIREPTRWHDDRPQQRWVAVSGPGGCLAIASEGSQAHSCTATELACNILRTPPYSSFGLNPEDHWQTSASRPHMDQGEHEITWRIGLLPTYDEPAIQQLADDLSLPPVWQVVFPQARSQRRSALADCAEAVRITPASVRVQAVKRSEDGSALVVRLQELSGRATRCRLTVRGRKRPIELRMPAHGLRSIRIERRGKRASVVNHVEEPLDEEL